MTLDHQEISRLCRSMGLMLHGGVGLADGIFLLAREEQPPLGELLEAMGSQLDSGSSLSEAMENSRVFPEFVTGLVCIGEETGRVEEALNALAEDYEEQYRTERQIRAAVAYPGMIFVLMLAVIGVLLVQVLPVFDRVYASLGTRMTGAAAGLLYLGQLLKRLLPVLLLLLAALVLAAAAYRLVPAFRERVQRLFRSRFADMGIAWQFNNARFARGFAMGLSSGLTPEAAAEFAGKLLGQIPQADRRCKACIRALREGIPPEKAMEAAQLLSPARSRMLGLGIRGGSADTVMQTIADQMMDEARASLDAAVSRVEPVMVLAASALVGLILLAVMLPLVDILSVIG